MSTFINQIASAEGAKILKKMADAKEVYDQLVGNSPELYDGLVGNSGVQAPDMSDVAAMHAKNVAAQQGGILKQVGDKAKDLAEIAGDHPYAAAGAGGVGLGALAALIAAKRNSGKKPKK